MKKKVSAIVSVLLAVMMVVSMAPASAITFFSENSDVRSLLPSEDNIVKISSAEELFAFSENGADSDAILTEDIDLSEVSCAPMFADGYNGTFDGNGKTVTLKIEDASAIKQGLFSSVGEKGIVKNLNVAGVITVKGSRSGRNYHGSIAGFNYGKIQNCTASAGISVSGTQSGTNNVKYCGGIVGKNMGTVENCTYSGNIDITTYAGGIVGENNGGSVKNCINDGNITAHNVSGYAGGIIGVVTADSYDNKMIVEGCENRGAVTGGTGDIACAAGIIAQENVSSSYNTYQGKPELEIKNCTNSAEVTALNKDDILAKQSGNCTVTIAAVPAVVEVEKVTISGTAKTRELLTASALGAEDKIADDVSYVWYSGDGTDFTAIDGANTAQFTVTDDLAGKILKVVATGENSSTAFAVTKMIEKSDAQCVDEAAQALVLDCTSAIKDEIQIDLPLKGDNDTKIVWTSDDESIISANGSVTLPVQDKQEVTLTAEISKGEAFTEKGFTFTVYSRALIDIEKQDLEYVKNAGSALEDSWYKMETVFGTDTNVIDMLSAELTDLGYGDLTVTIKECDNEYIDESGEITYFYKDPNGFSAMWFASVPVTFALTKGSASVEYSKNVTVHWDADKVKETVTAEIADNITEDLIKGDNGSVSGVKTDLVLPKVIDDKKWTLISWQSSDPNVIEIDSSNQNTADTLFDPYIGKVKRGTEDKTATLTAVLNFQRTAYNEPEIVITKTFDVTVKGFDDSELLQQMQSQLDENYTADKLKIFGTDSAVDTDKITDDIQLIIPSKTGVQNYGNYTFTVTSSDEDAINIASYRADVYRPLPGETAKSVVLTVKMASKTSNLAVSKEIPVTVAPLTQEEIDAEIKLMEAVKSAYFDGINNGANTDSEHINADLSSFCQAVSDGDGVKFIYDIKDVKGAGIIPVSIDESRPSEQWDRFKSSDSSVISHENLLFNQPEYDTKVTVTSCLSSEYYEKYAVKYPENEDFKKLYRQSVLTELTVLGEKGVNPDDNKTITGTFTLIGDTAHGESAHIAFINWIDGEEFTVKNGKTVMDVFSDVLDRNGFTYEGEGFVTSVTSPGGLKLDGKTNGAYCGWLYAVNGVLGSVGADQYVLKDGDAVTWFYTDNYNTDGKLTGNDEITSDVKLPDYTAQWSSFRNSENNNGVTDAKTPTDKDFAITNWSCRLRESTDWSTSVSDPIIVNDNIYIAAGSELIVLDKSGGEINKTTLAASIDYTCRPLYNNGMVIVPLGGGRLQALAADSLKTVWITNEVVFTADDGEKSEQQTLTTVTYSDGYIYAGTANSDWQTTYNGVYMCVEALTGKVIWEYRNNNKGYYWSGAVCTENAVIFVGDDGKLLSLDKRTGDMIAVVDIGTSVRSTVVMDGSNVFFTATDGTLYKIYVNEDGTFGNQSSVKFAASSTCTPAVYDGKIYVGGGLGKDNGYKGIMTVIDSEALTVVQSVNTPADVKSAPLVSKGNEGEVYAYYTSNINPGCIYVLKLGESTKEPVPLYTPGGDGQNYCLASVICDEEGSLYYTNDSGKLFAVANSDNIKLGDVNFDGEVDLKDILLIQKHMAELIALSEAAKKAADVNCDGQIDLHDIIDIQKYLAELIVFN